MLERRGSHAILGIQTMGMALDKRGHESFASLGMVRLDGHCLSRESLGTVCHIFWSYWDEYGWDVSRLCDCRISITEVRMTTSSLYKRRLPRCNVDELCLVR